MNTISRSNGNSGGYGKALSHVSHFSRRDWRPATLCAEGDHRLDPPSSARWENGLTPRKPLVYHALVRLSDYRRAGILGDFEILAAKAPFSMRFTLIDRITDLQPGSKLIAVKNLTLGEEYLQDHFPLFPVMPGVLMLESVYQASAWLVRCSDDFAHSMVQLSEAKNVKYADFVEPGETMVVETRIQREKENLTWLSAEGSIGDRGAVKARLVLERYNLADRDLAARETDAYMVMKLREQFQNLYPPARGQAA